MESPGLYWRPVYNILEGLMVVNAQHLKAVPGRKPDEKDAELRGSFIPKSLVRQRSAQVNRLQKVLEGANIKLAAVATNIVGVSARAMLQAIVAGQENPQALAELAQGRLPEKRQALERALVGRVTSHHRFLLAEILAHLEFLEEAIQRLSAEVEERLGTFQEELLRLERIPGVGRYTAQVLLAEVGPRMERFLTAHHLASWAGLCPGNHESGGKRYRGRIRKGSPWLRESLIEAARAAAGTKTSLGALYRRLAVQRHLVRRLEGLGLVVSVEPVAAST